MMTLAILGYPGLIDCQLAFPGEPGKQAFYEGMVKCGRSERLAEMLAAQSPPGLGLTRAGFMKGRHDGGIADPEVDAHYRRMANAAGVSPVGKVYSSSLASFPGDPEAWVSSPSEVKEVAERKNLKLEGDISHTPARYIAPVEGESVDDGEYVVAEEIVSDELELQADANPALIDEWKAKSQSFEDAKQKAKDTLSGND